MPASQDVKTLRRHCPELFRLPAPALDVLFRNAITKVMPGGRFFDAENRPCTSFDILLEGAKRIFKVDSSGKVFTLFTLSPFQICHLNVLCILAHEPFPAQAQALTPARVLSIPADDFRGACDGWPEMRTFMLRSACVNVSSLIELLSEIVFRGVRDRLEDLLRARAHVGVVASTHQALAEELGTSREVVSKLLKQMEHEGRISMARMRIRLLDAMMEP